MNVRFLGFSFSLHLAVAALLGGLRASMPAGPALVMIDLMPTLPEQKLAEVSQAPVLSKSVAHTAPKAAQPRPAATPAATAPTTAKIEETPSADTGQMAMQEGPDVVARRLSVKEAYENSVRIELERAKRYPPMAKRLNQTGKVTVRFTVTKDGSVQNPALVAGSPFPTLNQAAEALVQSMKKFQPIPDELKALSWDFTVPIEYKLE